MNSNLQMMKWLGLLVSLLLIPASLAAPERSDVFNPPFGEQKFDFCQTYTPGVMQLENIAPKVSVRYIGTASSNRNKRHGTYSMVANGNAIIFNGSDCKLGFQDSSTFSYVESWRAENLTPPGVWWDSRMDKFEVEFIIAGIARFDGERSHQRWEWRSQYFGRRTLHAKERWYAKQSDDITEALKHYGFDLRIY